MITNTELIARLQGFPEGTPVITYSVRAKIYHSAPKYLASLKVDRSQESQSCLPEFLDGKEAILI